MFYEMCKPCLNRYTFILFDQKSFSDEEMYSVLSYNVM